MRSSILQLTVQQQAVVLELSRERMSACSPALPSPREAVLSGQCKEIEGNNRGGKISALSKKIRVTKGTLHAKMGPIKDRNGMDLTEAEGTKKRWQEYTEELFKNDLHDPDEWCDHDGVITHLEPDILECEVSGP